MQDSEIRPHVPGPCPFALLSPHFILTRKQNFLLIFHQNHYMTHHKAKRFYLLVQVFFPIEINKCWLLWNLRPKIFAHLQLEDLFKEYFWSLCENHHQDWEQQSCNLCVCVGHFLSNPSLEKNAKCILKTELALLQSEFFSKLTIVVRLSWET